LTLRATADIVAGMSLSRFSVSLDAALLKRFDAQLRAQGYPTRSKALSDLIRESLVRDQWKKGEEVAAAIVLVYDHHKRDLSHRLTHIQHDHHHLIISTQHVHLDHDNCLEIIVARGPTGDVENLARKLKTTKGVKFASLAAASTGHDL
jgi:CopG family nickel-responsive transcriptional regulator